MVRTAVKVICDSVAVERPLRIKRLVSCAALGDSRYLVSCEAAVCVPAAEGISRLGRVFERYSCGGYIVACGVIGMVRTAVKVICDSVAVERPLRIKGNGCAVGGGQVVDACLVGIVRTFSVSLGVPACKGISRTGESVRCQSLCCAVLERLGGHRSRTAVIIEAYLVAYQLELSGNGHIVNRHNESIVGHGDNLVI